MKLRKIAMYGKMKTKKKVLFVTFSLGNGGAERALINLLNSLDYAKYDIDLLQMRRNVNKECELNPSIKILEVPHDVAALSGQESPTMRERIAQLIRKAICLLHIAYYGIKKTGYAAGQLKWKYIWDPLVGTYPNKYDTVVGFLQGFPDYYSVYKVIADKHIIWIHAEYDKLNSIKEIDAELFSQVDEICTMSKICQEQLNNDFSQISSYCRFIPNYHPVLRVISESKKDISDVWQNSVYRILSVGRLVQIKRFDRAIEAAAILSKRGLRFQWVVLGEGPLRKDLEDMVLKRGLKGVFVFYGAVPNPYPYIASADVVVQSSDSEGKSMVLDEAKILKRAIVSTNYPTAIEQIIDGWTGYLCDLNPSALAEAVDKALVEGAPLGLDVEFQIMIEDMNEALRMHQSLL